MRSLPSRGFVATNLREHLGIYVLGSLSNAFLTVSQYLAVSSAIASYLPVDPGTTALVTAYGRGPGVFLALFLNSLIFQGILAGLVMTLALLAVVKKGWKRAYALIGVVVSGFVGFLLGAKFVVVLEWISILQNNSVDSSADYASLFWLGLVSTMSYLAMILVLRKSYGNLVDRRQTSSMTQPTILAKAGSWLLERPVDLLKVFGAQLPAACRVVLPNMFLVASLRNDHDGLVL